MLDELKYRDEISKKHNDTLKKRIDWIYQNPIPIVKCVTNKMIKLDMNELHTILTESRKNVNDDERIVKLEKLLGADDYIDGNLRYR